MDATIPNDPDPQETREWLDALSGVIENEGPDRAHFLIEGLIARARRNGAYLPFSANTAYINTIPVERQVRIPGDQAIEHTIRSYVRWNAMAMVLRANKDTNVGGHIASFASAATLYDVGLQPLLARAVRQARRRPRVRAGPLGARRLRARLHARGAAHRRADGQLPAGSRRQGDLELPAPVADAGLLAVPDRVDGARPADGDLPGAVHAVPATTAASSTPTGARSGASAATARWTSPESLGAIGMAARENLDNLIFVINCNLQRLDGPVRGNGKIIQELESDFRGAGWNVIKVIWGTHWDTLLARDKKGILMRRMMECVDGEYQTFKSKDGAYVREHFFNTPELKELVADWSDDDIWNAEPRRPRPAQGLRRVPRGGEPQGPADGHPRQDDQGLRDGRVRRGAEHHAPAEEDDRRLDPHLPRPLPDPDPRRPARRRPVRQVRRGVEGARLHARAAHGARRLPAARAGARPNRSRFPSWRRSSASSRAPRIGRSRRRWRSCRSCRRWCATSTSASTSCRSSPTSRARSAWKAMFRQLGIWNQQRPALHAAGRRPADVLQGEPGTGRSCRKGSTRRAACATGSRRRRATRRTACR